MTPSNDTANETAADAPAADTTSIDTAEGATFAGNTDSQNGGAGGAGTPTAEGDGSVTIIPGEGGNDPAAAIDDEARKTAEVKAQLDAAVEHAANEAVARAKHDEAVRQARLSLIGAPVLYRASHKRMIWNGAEHHAGIVTRVLEDGIVNLKVFPDNAASFDLTAVPVVSKQPHELEPGEACPRGWRA
jgi:hypothetical protein